MKFPLLRIAAAFLLMFLEACSQPPGEVGPIPLSLEKYAGELKVINLERDGKIYRFLFDTGGGFSVLDSKFAEAFGCTPYGLTTGFRMSGEKVTAQNCDLIALDIAGETFRFAPKVMDINAFLPEGLPELAGLFSLHTFQDRLFTIDYAGGFITIETEKSFQERIQDMKPLPLKVSREKGGEAITIYTKVLETPEPLWFYLDSANLRGVLIAPHAASVLGLEESGPVTLDVAGRPYKKTAEVLDIIYDGALDVEFFKAHVIALDLNIAKAWIMPAKGE